MSFDKCIQLSNHQYNQYITHFYHPPKISPRLALLVDPPSNSSLSSPKQPLSEVYF